jgi:hypothetical protein
MVDGCTQKLHDAGSRLTRTGPMRVQIQRDKDNFKEPDSGLVRREGKESNTPGVLKFCFYFDGAGSKCFMHPCRRYLPYRAAIEQQ